MSEEEKNAIEILRFSTLIRGRKPENDAVEILLNLIEKQQKEIERIKSLDIYKLVEDWEKGELVSKDKIREKIKELEQDMVLKETRQVLKELLEE